MSTNLHLRLGLLPLLAALAACSDFVDGNGVYAERVLEPPGLPEFRVVAIGFPAEVDVSGHPPAALVHAGASARKVVLSGDENVIEHIEVKVDGSGRLYATIGVDGYSSVHPPQLRIDAPDLVGVESSGGSDVTVHDAPDGDLAVHATERGHVILEGSGATPLRTALSATLSGGALLEAAGYRVLSARLELTGASTAKVWPEEVVQGTAADGSVVLVKGPAGCDMALSGGATCGPLP